MLFRALLAALLGLTLLLASPVLVHAQTWTQLMPATSPGRRYTHAMVYDVARGRIVLFGGGGSSGLFNDTWEYVGGPPPSSYSVFGAACGGTAGLPTLIPNQLPRVGQFFSIIFSHLPPNSSGIVCTGTSRDRWGSVMLPLDLTPFGFTGCSLYIAAEAVSVIPDTGPFGAVVLGVLIENDPGLVGLQFFNQAAFMDAGANPGGFVLTNAGAGVIGR